MKRNINISYYFILLFFCLTLSCEKYLELDAPRDRVATTELFSNDASATAAVTGIYSRMINNGGFSGNQNSISVLTGLTSDELLSHNVATEFFFKNEIPSTNSAISNFIWAESYGYVFTCNSILANLDKADGLTETTKRQLEGEAKFIRAFCYFYLTNLFGDVPLNLSVDYRVNMALPRTDVKEVYKIIVSDLIDAENLMSANYVSGERIRPNKAAAKALLARVYLYTGQWGLAEQKSTEIIDQKNLYNLETNLNQVFLKNSGEAIWQLMPAAGRNTNEGTLFILTSNPSVVSLNSALLSLFESADSRRVMWIGQFTSGTRTSYFPSKYKVKNTINGVISEYSTIIRLAEIYLIRAEARSQQNNINGAVDDINKVRQRPQANGSPSNAVSTLTNNLNKQQILDFIEIERRRELFSEWGHRWLDLKRNNRASNVLSQKNSTWSDSDVFFPIPNAEILLNPNIKQNPGY